MAANPRLDVVGGSAAFVRNPKSNLADETEANLVYGGYVPIGSSHCHVLWPLMENQFLTANSAFSKQSQRKFNSRTKAKWEDWEFFQRLAEEDGQLSLVPDAFFLYRVREGSMSRTYSDKSGFERMLSSSKSPFRDRIRASIASASNRETAPSNLSRPIHPLAVAIDEFAYSRQNTRLAAFLRPVDTFLRKALRRFVK